MGLLPENSLLPVTANAKMLAQSLKARQQPRTQLTGQGLLDTAAVGLSPVPVIGDALGLAADFSRYMNDPSSRTPLNFGLTALGALPFVPPAAAIFAGPLAKTAKLDQKAIAEGMEKAGRSRDDIWKETGWFKGPEGKWKFEIDDSGAKNLKGLYESRNNGVDVNLNKAIKHDDLYKAYPQAKGVLANFGWGGEGARFSPQTKFMEIGYGRPNPQSSALHETQHFIQDLEGFSKGGNAREMGNAMGGYRELNERFNAAFDKYVTSADEIVKSNALQEMDYLKPKIAEFNKFSGITSPEEAYTKLAGEAEARAVQARLNMSPATRQQIPPWVSYDIPFEQLKIK